MKLLFEERHLSSKRLLVMDKSQLLELKLSVRGYSRKRVKICQAKMCMDNEI